ncbi:histidine phosphatase family protein [Halolamina rubra]|uniref:histidine phosphatase family protein n=1 Tax=Halolamina rubra TaxID=1380430 RepID=UPI000678D76C|nr:histidine phosphatase family protein [Halolamina rubra]
MTGSKTLYLVRHGQTPWTAAERVQGWAPVPLNDAGRDQLRATGAYLDERVDADAVCIETSDLRRASQSAEIVADRLGDRATITSRKALRERDFGVLQGLDDTRYHRVKESHTGDGPGALLRAPERGESWREVENRTLEAWWEIVEATVADEPRIVVSHTGPMYCVLAAVTGRRLEAEMNATDLPEGGVFEIEIATEDGESRLVGDVWTPE